MKNPHGPTVMALIPQLCLCSMSALFAVNSFSIPHVVADDENFLGITILNTSRSGGVSLRQCSISPKCEAVIRYLRTENHSAECRCSLVDCSTCCNWAGVIFRLCLNALTRFLDVMCRWYTGITAEEAWLTALLVKQQGNTKGFFPDILKKCTK